MKHFPFLMLGLLVACGTIRGNATGQHWPGGLPFCTEIAPAVDEVGDGDAAQKKILLQQPKKKSASTERQQQLRQLRAKRDSLNRAIVILEQKKTTSALRKKITTLTAKRDLLANKIRQVLKSGISTAEKKGKHSKTTPKKQQSTERSRKIDVAPKKGSNKNDKIEKIIDKLDAKEKRNGNAERPVTGVPATPKPKPATTSALSTLHWPVDSRKILLEYGERYNPQTNTVTINPGINIRVDDAGEVSSAESGVVRMVTWVPGYRTVVIVDHGSGFRTVYANLSSAMVKLGGTLHRGDRIGTASRSKEGRYLHFQVWKERQRMNPITMLR